MKAIWNGQVLAESDATVVVEGNHYFPVSSVNMEFLKPSKTSTRCPWKGDASYYSVVVNAEESPDAAWTYPAPKEAAKEIKDRVAFGHGVKVLE